MAPQVDDKSRTDKRTKSIRKAEANRRNALQSTGPRTLRGKKSSRRNALKHGLFARDLFVDFAVQKESPEEFVELEARLQDELQPVGRLEELETQYIAVCWWKRSRLWRYENAEIRAALREVAVRGAVSRPCRAIRQEDGTLNPLLESAEKEIETNGEISRELKEKMFASSPWFSQVLSSFEGIGRSVAQEKDLDSARKLAREYGVAFPQADKLMGKHPEIRQARTRFAALLPMKLAIAYIESCSEQQHQSAQNVAYELQAIPDSRALDKILRYGGMIERELSRAYERLDRLQRRRQGELVPPSLNLNVT